MTFLYQQKDQDETELDKTINLIKKKAKELYREMIIKKTS